MQIKSNQTKDLMWLLIMVIWIWSAALLNQFAEDKVMNLETKNIKSAFSSK